MRSCLILLSFAVVGCSEAPVAQVAPVEAPPPPPVAGPPAPPATVMLGGGCEQAKAAYLDDCQRNPTACTDTSKSSGGAAYTEVLNGGAYLDGCKAPPSTGVKICAAIRGGRAVGVTVTTDPGDPKLATCVGKAIEALKFAPASGLDVTRTTFAAQ